MSTVKNNEWFDPNTYRKIEWNAIGRFLSYYKPLKRPIIMALVFAIAASAVAFFIPVIFSRVSTAISEQSNTAFLVAVGMFFAVLLGQAVLSLLIETQQARIFTRLNKDLLLNYFENLLGISVPSFLAFKKKTNLFQRVIDVMSITSVSTKILISGVRHFINCVALLVIISMLSVEVVVLVAVGALLLYSQLVRQQPRLRMRRQKTLGFGYPLVSKMLETLNCLITIKSLAASPAVTSDIADLVNNKRHAEEDENIYQARVSFITAVVIALTQVSSLGLCLWLFKTGQIPLSDVFAIYVLMGMLLGSIQFLGMLYMEMAVISVNFRNFFEVLDLPKEQSLAFSGRLPAPAIKGEIVFKDASFGYLDQSRRVINGMNFDVKSGERIAVIGKSGAGKTTMMRLLLDFLQADGGKILIDGQPIETYEDKNAYRNNFGIVNQNDFFFQISLRDNLTFGMDEPPDDEILVHTLKQVKLWDTIAGLDEKLDTVFTDHQFSGGEKQRLYIARALVRDPRIILMDEPTSALDFESEGAVLEAMDVLMEGKTSLIIAHRLSTIQNADRLLVLEDGKIAATGKHEDLYETCDYYRELCNFNSFIA